MLIWFSGSSPPFCAATAMPASVWVCITQAAFGAPICRAEWMTKPAGFTGQLVSCAGSPAASTSTREEAVISSKSSP